MKIKMLIDKPLIISFEGGEGSGKSTISKEFFNFLFGIYPQKIDVFYFNDPNSTDPVCKKIRSILLDSKNEINEYAELMLYIASRFQMLERINFLMNKYNDGCIIILDRYIDSTRVYQGMDANEKKLNLIKNLENYFPKPDLTFLLNIDAELGLKRSMEKLNNMCIDESRFENKGIDYHKKINSIYQDIAYNEKDRFKIINIDNNKTTFMILDDVINYFFKFLQKKLILRI